MLTRTHTCGCLREDHVNETVTLTGWVNAQRAYGDGLVFVDVRDRHGVTQLVFEKDSGASDELIAQAAKLRQEDVIGVVGKVRARAGKPNEKIATGKVEVVVERVDVLSKTDKLPLIPDEKEELPSEEIRLKHRYLDLRRPSMQRLMALRHRVTKVARDYFDENGFLEIETPILCKSTPEGARDFLVPSRLQPGKWYALPQSPQIFKQLLMISGCDRYMQICRCFRDEDLRADRQPEFSQIDLEMSFVDRDSVMRMMEGFAKRVWKESLGVELGDFAVMSYHEVMDRYGIDRPDTRFGLELVDVTELAKRTDFKVFTGVSEKRLGVVKAIRVPGGAEKMTRKVLDGYSEFVKDFGAGGVPFVKYTGKGFEGGVSKFLEPIAEELVETLGLEAGDVVLFGADSYSVCTKALGELRVKVAKDLDLIPDGRWNFLWVVDFPMFEWDEDTQRFYAMHHPFTGPREDQLEAFLAADVDDRDAVEAIVSDGYDMVVNGSEVGGGSIRIHRRDVQQKVFTLLGMSDEEARERFSFLLEALRYGTPPMGGIAFGLDRIVMHLGGTDNIRDVIAFPKTATGSDLMSESPSGVDAEQLQELFVKNTV